jgi:hypothetical protein
VFCGTAMLAVSWPGLPSRAEIGVLLVASREAGAGADETESSLTVGVPPRR